MNFKDYLAILESEGLEESPLADGLLFQAMEAKDDEEKKLECIWGAIDLARLYKDDPEMREFVHREFEKENGYRHRGFLHEYRMTKENASGKN